MKQADFISEIADLREGVLERLNIQYAHFDAQDAGTNNFGESRRWLRFQDEAIVAIESLEIEFIHIIQESRENFTNPSWLSEETIIQFDKSVEAIISNYENRISQSSKLPFNTKSSERLSRNIRRNLSRTIYKQSLIFNIIQQPVGFMRERSAILLLGTVIGLVLSNCTSLALAQDPYADTRPISWRDLLDRERAPADARIEYGQGEEQYGELWLPDGDGPFPLVIMVHGGCWQAAIPGTILQDQLNADLKARNIAVWNITYPRLGHETGGYPGTFTSVAMATDHVRTLAETYPIDLERTVLMGHSAGGHLALWAAARGQLQDSPLYVEDPFIPNGVITLAGINDLELYRAEGPGRCGEPDTVDALIAGHPGAAPYADTSPDQLLPLQVEQVVISGDLDPIVPPQFGVAYAAEAETAGDTVTEITLENAGHFELIDPTAPAWAVILNEVERLLGE